MRLKLLPRLLLGLLLIGLVSCGYHLRGQTQLPEQALPVYLFTGDVYHDLRRELSSQLRRSGIATTHDKALAATVITITSVEKSSGIISVDSFGRTSEIQLVTVVGLHFTFNKTVIKKKIRVYKDISFNPENILSFKREENVLYDEMLVELSRLILLQLQAKVKHAF